MSGTMNSERTRPLVNGVVAAIVATVAATVVGGRKRGIRVGLLTGFGVAVSSWLSARWSERKQRRVRGSVPSLSSLPFEFRAKLFHRHFALGVCVVLMD